MLRTRLRLPYPPSTNNYWRVAQGRTHVTHEARAYKALIARAGLGLNGAEPVRPLIGPCRVLVHVYRPAARGDLDNTLKVLLDALRGVAYLDDDQVVMLVAFRHDDAENPRAEVLIKGEQYANHEEVLEHARRREETNRKRKETLARNRAARARGRNPAPKKPRRRATPRPAYSKPGGGT